MTNLLTSLSFVPVRYFSPEDQGGGTAATTTAAETAASGDALQTAANAQTTTPAQNNEANMWRRKAEDAQKRLDALAADEQKFKDLELSEVERLRKENEAAKIAAEAATVEALRLRLGKDLPDEALEFVTGSDEDSIRASVEKLRGLVKAPAATTTTPVRAGTVTNPQSGQVPTLDEQISAAEKAGNRVGALDLKLKQMRGE